MNISDRVKTFFWITSTIKRCGPVSLKEINRQWISTGLSNGQEFDRNTFRHHLDSIEDIFGIVIGYSGSGYSIADANAVNTQSLQEFLVSHVQNIDLNSLVYGKLYTSSKKKAQAPYMSETSDSFRPYRIRDTKINVAKPAIRMIRRAVSLQVWP